MAAPNRRGGSGRKKTVIRRIEQEDARHISYSKRRLGLFSKATNLAVLTGAQVAALAFSPGGKAFSFGHPSVESVVDRFLAGEGARAGAREEGAAGEDEKLEKLQQEFDELRAELDEAKKLKKLHEEVMAKERAAGDLIAAWVDPKVRDMGDEDMAAFFAALMQVKDAVSERAIQVLIEAMHFDMAPLLPPKLFGGSTFEFGCSSGSSNAGMEIQLPQGQGFELRSRDRCAADDGVASGSGGRCRGRYAAANGNGAASGSGGRPGDGYAGDASAARFGRRHVDGHTSASYGDASLTGGPCRDGDERRLPVPVLRR